MNWATPPRWPKPSGPSTTKSSSGWRICSTLFPKLIWHEDEPITWPSSVSLILCLATGGGTGQSGPHRERQRRAVRRLRALPHYLLEPDGRLGLPLCARPPCGDSIQSADPDHSAAERRTRGGNSATLSSGARTRSNRCCSITSTAPSPWRIRTVCSIPRPGRYTATTCDYWNARPKASRALARMLYADQKTYLVELSDEAGPDEHGQLDREPGAVPRSHFRRVRHADPGRA